MRVFRRAPRHFQRGRPGVVSDPVRARHAVAAPPGPATRPWGRGVSRVRSLVASPVRRSVMLLSSGALLSQAVQTITVPALGRLYSPAAFGLWTEVLAVAGLLTAFAALRYDLAVPLATDDAEAVNVAVLQMIIAGGLCGLALLIVVFFRQPLAVKLGSVQLAPLLFFVPLLTFLGCFAALAAGWFIRTKQFGRLTIVRSVPPVVEDLTQIALAAPMGGAAPGMVWGTCISLLYPLLLLRAQIHAGYGRLLRQSVTKGGMRDAARKHSNFPKYVAPYTLVSALRDRGVFIALGIFATTSIVGFYSVALKILYTTVGALTSNTLGTVVYQQAAAGEGREHVAGLLAKFLRTIVLWAAPAVPILVWSGVGHNALMAHVLARLLGDRWAGAAPFVALVAPPSFMYLMSGTISRLLDVVGQQRTGAIIEGSYTLLGLITLVVGLVLFKSALVALMVFTVITVAYHAAWVIAVYRAWALPTADLIRECGRTLAIMAVSGVGILLLGMELPQLAAFIVALIGLGVYYAVLLHRHVRALG